jgi:hypothetical protein
MPAATRAASGSNAASPRSAAPFRVSARCTRRHGRPRVRATPVGRRRGAFLTPTPLAVAEVAQRSLQKKMRPRPPARPFAYGSRRHRAGRPRRRASAHPARLAAGVAGARPDGLARRRGERQLAAPICRSPKFESRRRRDHHFRCATDRGPDVSGRHGVRRKRAVANQRQQTPSDAFQRVKKARCGTVSYQPPSFENAGVFGAVLRATGSGDSPERWRE